MLEDDDCSSSSCTLTSAGKPPLPFHIPDTWAAAAADALLLLLPLLCCCCFSAADLLLLLCCRCSVAAALLPLLCCCYLRCCSMLHHVVAIGILHGLCSIESKHVSLAVNLW